MSSLNLTCLDEVPMEALVNGAAEDDIRNLGHGVRLLRKQAECTAAPLHADTTERNLAKVAFGRCRGLEIVELVAVAAERVAGGRAVVQVECMFGIHRGVLDGDRAAPPEGVPGEAGGAWTGKAVAGRSKDGIGCGGSRRGQLRAVCVRFS
jgi:hypothetical protein